MRTETSHTPAAGPEGNGPQRVVLLRRTYNQWVANQTLEDYALRFTAKRGRRFSRFQVASTALGAVSFLALEAIGGTITIAYGFNNAVAAILVVALLIFLTGLPVTYHAAKAGLDIDLLTRGAGFGYIGSTVTSLIYASFTFIFLAIEAAIMALMLELWFGLPLWAGYVLSAVIVIPLVTHGITLISRFQTWTQPIWLGLHLLPFVFLGYHGLVDVDGWSQYQGMHPDADGHFNLLLFGAAASVIFALVAQIGEQVDYLRFLPRERNRGRLGWWVALLAAGPGWVIPGAVKMLLGSFLAYFALSMGSSPEKAVEPTEMYLTAFQQVTANPALALALTGIFVIISQLKINVTNAYAGSIAWSNFFSRLTRSHPGRVVWVVFNVAIALMLMQLGIYRALEQILGLYCLVAVSWMGALVADLVVNKPLGLSPRHIEFKRAHLYDINPVGMGSMLIALFFGLIAFLGLLGETTQALAPFLALAIPFFTAPLIALATASRYYIARTSKADWPPGEDVRCCVCEHAFEQEDMAACPAYNGPICSLCCSLDARCNDACKPHARISAQILSLLKRLFPEPLVKLLHSHFGHYLFLLTVMLTVVGSALAVIYVQATMDDDSAREVIGATLLQTFFVLSLVAGVVSWLIVLAHESRRSAEQESRYQNDLLAEEIAAHQRTDRELQRAKEAAEAANLAKSRYMVGMSHELRTPLNAVLGYAQLLERDPAMDAGHMKAIGVVKRSAEHLSGLIDGVLDISRIEGGRLQLFREEVRTRDLLEQLVQIFQLQAEQRGIVFDYHCAERLPETVYADEKRLRQVLINLLSNAIKFTDAGKVSFSVHYGSQVAEFRVRDTGIGIAADDQERIFSPFERISNAKGPFRPGMGIGLTITKLLAEIMGGDITLRSELGKGSEFRLRVMLSAVPGGQDDGQDKQRISGYKGRRLTVLVADDDGPHREVMEQFLGSLGFHVHGAEDGERCLALAGELQPDLFLLDITMPGMSGWELATRLRHRSFTGGIIMISADASGLMKFSQRDGPWSDYLTKPVDLIQLLKKMRRMLDIRWTHHSRLSAQPALPHPDRDTHPPGLRQVVALRRLAEIGHVEAVRAKLSDIARETPGCKIFLARAEALLQRFEFEKLVTYARSIEHEHPDADATDPEPAADHE